MCNHREISWDVGLLEETRKIEGAHDKTGGSQENPSISRVLVVHITGSFGGIGEMWLVLSMWLEMQICRRSEARPKTAPRQTNIDRISTYWSNSGSNLLLESFFM